MRVCVYVGLLWILLLLVLPLYAIKRCKQFAPTHRHALRCLSLSYRLSPSHSPPLSACLAESILSLKYTKM